MTQQEFSDFLNIAPATLSSILRERTRPTLSIVDAIVSRFPDISTDWLLFGKGPMKRSAEGQTDSSEPTERATESELAFDFPETETPSQRQSTPPQSAATPNLFSQPRNAAPQPQQYVVKNVDKQPRKITEIRIFYDDQTWETFVPKVSD